MTFWIGGALFIAGAMFGAFVGFFIAAMFAVACRADDEYARAFERAVKPEGTLLS